MNFCEICDRHLNIKEEFDENLKTRHVYLFCIKCNYKIQCDNFKLFYKNYQKTALKNNTIKMNEYKSNDITLPLKKSKCTNCNQTNLNRYEKKYSKSSFAINHICSNCFTNF